MENEKVVETQFNVNIYTDGTFSVQLEKAEDAPETQRNATVNDVYQWSHLLIQEIDSQKLTERIVTSLFALMQTPEEPTTSDVVKEALKERGIDPESTASKE
jgi:hypothetical protein